MICNKDWQGIGFEGENLAYKLTMIRFLNWWLRLGSEKYSIYKLTLNRFRKWNWLASEPAFRNWQWWCLESENDKV